MKQGFDLTRGLDLQMLLLSGQWRRAGCLLEWSPCRKNIQFEGFTLGQQTWRGEKK